MNTYTKIKYNCRHTTYLIEKKQYSHLGPWELAQMYIHLITCPFCRLYKKQTRFIASFLRRMFKANVAEKLDTSFKQTLRQIIEDRLSGK